MNNKIIGLSGTNGSGKDTVGELLAKNFGYLFISVTNLLREEARRRGEPEERRVTRTISAEWRRESGLAVLVDKAIEQYERSKDKYYGIVMSSLRNPGEADRIHELGGIMVWVDADPKIRYGRIQKNKNVRGRGVVDNKTYEEFLKDEEAEMTPHSDDDPALLNMLGVKQKCDIILDNNFSSLGELKNKLQEVLKLN
ncbi:MAG TPA: AAA family ATPase [Candidatus Sulfotelmatobacter sp.]|nr:AAA family ATPase [Candidatus Sulfotelmatobacter sp.]